MGKKTKMLRLAGNTFDEYARNHMAKNPPQFMKAERNIAMAINCFKAIGVAYLPPEQPASLDSSPVQADSGVQASGSARQLLRDVHGSGETIRGVDVHYEDVAIMKTLVELGYLTRDELSDVLGLTTKGREAIGLRPVGLPSLPVEVATVTGNIEERELAAQYLDAKIAGCERLVREGTLPENAEPLRYVAAVLGEIAHEYRIGMHLPALVVEGRIIPYNDYRGDGVLYQDGLRTFYQAVHASNVKAGWWTDLTTGEPKQRNLGELLMLFVTEIVEAYDAYVEQAADDKLPQHPGLGVELGDLEIRLADLAGALLAGRVSTWSGVRNPGEALFREVCVIAREYEKIRKTPEAAGDPELGDPMIVMDVAAMVDDKLAFNASRADHKIENRLKEDGKKT